MSDDHLKSLLRSAFSQPDTQGPSRDLWPSVVQRVEARTSWSMLDIYVAVGVITGVAVALAMLPKAVLLLASQL